MKDRFLYIYLIAFVFFADTYFVVSWLRPITIFNYFLIFYSFSQVNGEVSVEVRKLQNILYVFILSTFLINLYQNSVTQAFSSLVTTLPIPFILSVFYKSSENRKLVFFFAKIYLIYNGIYSALQLSGVYLTGGEVISWLPLMSVDNTFEGLGSQGLRISGASYSTIGFACTLGMMFFLYYYTTDESVLPKKTRKIFLSLIVIFIFMTQTRSVLFSIIPVIYLTNLIISKNKARVLLIASIGLGFIGIVLIQLMPYLIKLYPRLFLGLAEDGSIVHRIQANVYGVVGTFYLSPIVGMPYEKGLEAMYYGYHKLGLIIGYRFIDMVTQHNQPAFFFRYYGMIGFVLFCFVYRGMLKIAVSDQKSDNVKKVVFAIVVFHILYTLSHNNKFTGDYYIWYFLSLNFFQNNNQELVYEK